MRFWAYTVAIFAFVVMAISFYGYIEFSFSKQENYILSKEQKQIQISYDAVKNMYKIALKIIVKKQLLRSDVVDIIKRAQNANEEQKTILRGTLYRKLWGTYNNGLSDLNIRHLHFYLKNGKSFLRFDDLGANGDDLLKSRKTIKQSNISMEYISGFEGGRVGPGFRHVYPIVVNGEYVGGVELSLSFESLRQEITKLLPYMSFDFIMKKDITVDIVAKKHIERFGRCLLSDEWVVENPYLVSLERNKLNKIQIAVKHIISNPKKHELILSKMHTKKAFFMSLLANDNVYVIHFLPILDTSNNVSAYIMGGSSHKDLEELNTQKIIYLSLGILGSALLDIFLLIIFLNVKASIFRKNELETIAHTLRNGLIVFDIDGVVTFINDSACRLLGYDKSELLRTKVHDRIHNHKTKTEECSIVNVGITGKPYTGEEEFIKKNGNIFPVSVSNEPLMSEQKVVGTVTVFRDITQEKRAKAQIKKLAYYDFLTDLPNRKLFFDKLESSITLAKKHKKYNAIIYIDLDDFKEINDNFGHKYGDEILVNMSKRLQAQIREDDLLARIGGDEFVIIIDTLNEEAQGAKEILTIVIEKIYKSFQNPFSIKGQKHICGVSIGGVLYKHVDKINQSFLLDKADATMYAAKKSGKNTYEIRIIN